MRCAREYACKRTGSVRMENPLGLEPAELDAIRELRAGMAPDPGDPIWPELESIGLVDASSGVPVLTMLGRRYRTD
jgi:hypothetical protein